MSTHVQWTGKAPPAIHGAYTPHAAHRAVMARGRNAPEGPRETVCDGCGMLAACHRGVCAMCRLDGVPMRPKRRRITDRVESTKLPSAPDNFPTVQRERARALAIRAEDPKGWAEVLGDAVDEPEAVQTKPESA